MKRAALASFLVAGVAGLALAIAVGWELLVVGALAMAAGWFYTGGPRPYGYLGLGELFVFVFFGVVATAGSAYVQEESLSGLALAASVPVGLLATALLVVNNLRDIPGDTASGKRTLAVRLGDRRTRWFYVGLLVGAVVMVPVVAAVGERAGAALALAAVPLGRRPVIAVLGGARGGELVPVLGETGRAPARLRRPPGAGPLADGLSAAGRPHAGPQRRASAGRLRQPRLHGLQEPRRLFEVGAVAGARGRAPRGRWRPIAAAVRRAMAA